MANAPEPSREEWIRRLREIARQDAEELVPRPGFGVLGLAAPVLRPAALAATGQTNGEWESVSLAYGDPTAAGGPYVSITTASGPHVVTTEAEAELSRAIDSERDRVADHAGVDDDEPASPPEFERARLPFGEALICRHGTVWAARVAAEPGTVVTITGRGVAPESIRLETVADLRPYVEARNEIIGQLTERHRSAAPPVLEPAEGVAALRALAEHTLDQHARMRESARTPRIRAGEAGLYHALWRRAVREQQRVAGVDERAADEAVTLVVNHLGHLLEDAAWFADPRLRAAAIDETLRHAMLGDDVPSLAAQQAWARYWSARHRWISADPADPRASQPSAEAWLAAWAAWAQRA
ncbi:MAG TPA: hypothetical protein VNV62_29945 [Trebonia sp.]|nr:hypothetical protein [Trebonia sp.]